MKYSIKWDVDARLQLRELYKYIRKDSLSNAEKVRKDIVVAVSLLNKHPERYPADRDKKDNDGSYRAFDLHKFRISYRIVALEIRILRVRNARREPLPY